MLLDPGAQNHRQITYTYKATEMKEDRQLWWQILGGSIQVFVILFLYFSKFLSFSKQKHIDVFHFLYFHQSHCHCLMSKVTIISG